MSTMKTFLWTTVVTITVATIGTTTTTRPGMEVEGVVSQLSFGDVGYVNKLNTYCTISAALRLCIVVPNHAQIVVAPAGVELRS